MVKRRFRRRKGTNGSWEKKVARVAKKACMAVAETKYHDVDIDLSASYDGNSVGQCLTLLAQGDTDATLEGNEMIPLWVQMKFVCTADAVPVTDSLIRLLLIQFDDSSGALPNIEDALETDDFYAFRDVQLNGNYSILWDKVFRLRKPGLQTILPRMYISKFRKLPKKKITYLNGGGTITSVARNHLYLYAMNLNATGEQPEILGKVRVAFKDF